MGHQSQETTGQAGMEQWHRRAQLTGVCGALFMAGVLNGFTSSRFCVGIP